MLSFVTRFILLVYIYTWMMIHISVTFNEGFYSSFDHLEEMNPRIRRMEESSSSYHDFTDEERSELQDQLMHDFSDPMHPTSELALHDYNRDGRLDGHELRFLFLNTNSLDEINQYVQEMLDMDDENNDGFITRNEL
ncbi:hypothetical protein HMI56_006665 [Coelomomyces lativittatus]|nr:hypothetical protein HMI56_006665 [Coelomomyces lativittatus]